LSAQSSEWGEHAPSWQRRRRTPDSARVNIYLPPELGQRLARARERGIDINVSKVCQDALKELLDRIDGGESF
jgi:post-segregation antitoxin (ccd killing protein)